MKMLILGDVHGVWSDLSITIARALKRHPGITHIIQVGDLAYGWPGTKPFKASRAFLEDAEMETYRAASKLFLDGNHENHNRIDAEARGEIEKWMPDWTHMPRGSVLEVDGYRVMFFGGATSSDKAMRTEGVSWWRQESITYAQVMETFGKVSGKLDAIFSHEHPRAVPYSDSRYTEIIGKGDMAALDALREKFKPKWLFFGHHHREDHGVVEGSEWLCAPIIESRKYIIWDGQNITCSWWDRGQSRFFSKVVRTRGGCWLWHGAVGMHGYGNLQVDNKWYRAHRYAYEYFHGPIPDGMVLDHTCSVRHCVNPEHIEVVTQRTNVLRGENHIADQVRQTYCVSGHKFDEANTYIDKRGRRHCRACRARRQKEYRNRRNKEE